MITSATNQYTDAAGTWSSLYRKGANGPKPAQFNLIDPKAPFYDGAVSNVELPLDDTPGAAADNGETSVTFKAKYEDTAMTQGPNNGIWVPNQLWKWSVDIFATNNGAGWVSANNGGNIPPAAPAPTTAYPTWKSNAAAYTNYIQIA